MGPLERVVLLSAALAAAPALACDVPDEGGNTPWRRAVAKVKHLPETEAMAAMQPREQGSVQYVVSLDEPKHLAGRCWWPVDVRVEGRTWKRFLVTPDGSALREVAANDR